MTSTNDAKRRMLLARLVDSPYVTALKHLGRSAILEHVIPWLSNKLKRKAKENGWAGHLAKYARSALSFARDMGTNMDPVEAE